MWHVYLAEYEKLILTGHLYTSNDSASPVESLFLLNYIIEFSLFTK